MARCKSCGAELRWIKTTKGKAMPCNAEAVTYWANPKGKATIITPNGETTRADLTGDLQSATGIGYIPHWSTCPQADNFRAKKGK